MMKSKVALLSSFLLSIPSCYASSRTGTTQDTREDIEPDRLETMDTDIAVPPFRIDFVVTNASPLSCSFCIVYLDYTSGNLYSLEVNYNEQEILWHPPECTMDCSSVLNPEVCCIACGPAVPKVKQLVPGESVVVSWNGYGYWMDYETCPCGCYRGTPVEAGNGNAAICAYTSYDCLSGDECHADSDGIITMANVSGEPLCAEATFSFPRDSNSQISLIITRGD